MNHMFILPETLPFNRQYSPQSALYCIRYKLTTEHADFPAFCFLNHHHFKSSSQIWWTDTDLIEDTITKELLISGICNFFFQVIFSVRSTIKRKNLEDACLQYMNEVSSLLNCPETYLYQLQENRHSKHKQCGQEIEEKKWILSSFSLVEKYYVLIVGGTFPFCSFNSFLPAFLQTDKLMPGSISTECWMPSHWGTTPTVCTSSQVVLRVSGNWKGWKKEQHTYKLWN